MSYTDTAVYWNQLKFKAFYLTRTNLDSASIIQQHMESVGLKSGNQLILAYAYNVKSIVFVIQSEMDSAIFVETKAKEIFEHLNNKTQVAKSYIALGSFYLGQDKFEKALENYHYSYVLFDSLGNERQKIIVSKEIGKCLSIQGNHEEAKPLFYQILNLCQTRIRFSQLIKCLRIGGIKFLKIACKYRVFRH